MKDITGKTAFITGAASGIGLALTKRFTAAGANVMMADINADALAAAASTVTGNTATVVCDVADPASVKSAADATLAAFGAVHISSAKRLAMGHGRQLNGRGARH